MVTIELKKLAENLANYFELTLDEITQKSRVHSLVGKRQFITAYLSILSYSNANRFSKGRPITLSDVGLVMKYLKGDGTGDHTTVLHCQKKVQSLCDVDKSYKNQWDLFCDYADRFPITGSKMKRLEFLPEKY